MVETKSKSPAKKSIAKVEDSKEFSAMMIKSKPSAKVFKPDTNKSIALPRPDYSNEDVWDLYYSSPEISYIVRTVRNAMSRVSFIPILENGKHLYDSDNNPIDGVTSELAEAATKSLKRVKSPLGNQSQVIGALAGALACPADTWLVAYYGDPMTAEPSNTNDAREMWVTVSRKQVEIKDINGEQILHLKLDPKQSKAYEIRQNFKVCRLWIPKLNSPAEADSWISPLTGAILSLERLYQALAATVLSQLNAGILVVPSDQDPAPDSGEHTNETEGEDGETEKLVFSEQLVDAIADYVESAALETDAAARTQPLAVAIDSDVRMLEWIEVARQIDPEISGSIDKFRYQIAIGSPFPAEKLLGQNQAKFYQGVHNVKSLDQDEFRNIYDPICEIIAEAFTRFVLYEDLEALVESKSVSFTREDYEKIIVGWDNSKLVAPPDNCDKALLLRREEAISKLELRIACGWEGDYVESDVTASPDNPPTAPVSAQKAASSTVEDDPIDNYFVEKYKENLGLISDQAVYRMCEKAGNRLLSAANKPIYQELKKEFKQVDVTDIGTLPRVFEFSQEVGEDEQSLFAAGLIGLKKQFVRLTKSAFIGVDVKKVEKAWENLADMLLQYANELFFGQMEVFGENDLRLSDVHSIPESIINSTLKILVKE